MQPQNELAAISKRSGSPHEGMIRKWLAVFAENASKEVSPGLLGVWLQAFAAVEPSVLEAAFRKTLASWRITQIPPVGEIMQHITEANTTVLELSAERAWSVALRSAHDLGNDYEIASAKEPEDQALVAGVRAAGGWRWIAQCSDEQLVWAKKTFLDIYEKHKNAPEILQLASGEDAETFRKLFAQLGERKALPQ